MNHKFTVVAQGFFSRIEETKILLVLKSKTHNQKIVEGTWSKQVTQEGDLKSYEKKYCVTTNKLSHLKESFIFFGIQIEILLGQSMARLHKTM